MFDIDKIRAYFKSDLRGTNIVLDQAIQFVVGKNLVIRGYVKF